MATIKNKSVFREYEIEKTWQAGIVLTGPEVKSVRLGQVSLKGSHVKVLSGEVFLVNAQITPYKFSKQEDYDPKRTRKLLLKKSEINQLIGLIEQKKRALVPVAIEIDRRIKVTIGLGRGLKQYERREKLKRRDQKREVEAQVKSSLRGF